MKYLYTIGLLTLFLFAGCKEDDEENTPQPTSTTQPLYYVSFTEDNAVQTYGWDSSQAILPNSYMTLETFGITPYAESRINNSPEAVWVTLHADPQMDPKDPQNREPLFKQMTDPGRRAFTGVQGVSFPGVFLSLNRTTPYQAWTTGNFAQPADSYFEIISNYPIREGSDGKLQRIIEGSFQGVFFEPSPTRAPRMAQSGTFRLLMEY